MSSFFSSSKMVHYAVLAIFLGGIIFIGLHSNKALADHTEQFKGGGFAWGGIDDTGDDEAETGIGYISFGCETDVGSACDSTATGQFPSGYGVRINTNSESSDNGKFFGYAWSSNYGWISFYHGDVASCGSAGGLEIPGDVQTFTHTAGSSTTLNGFAKVINADDQYWDGCIRFADSDVFDVGSQYESILTTVSSTLLSLDGWAYGGELVGWISLDGVVFRPVDEECPEADDSEECAEFIPGGLSLSVGQGSPSSFLGLGTYLLQIEDVAEAETVTLIPQTFSQAVDSCTASWSSTGPAGVTNWDGPLNQAGLNPLNEGDVSNQINSTISNYQIGEIITYTITCTTVETDEVLSADAFVTIQFPVASVSITANPTITDPTGSSILSWDFDNVDEQSCEISGFVDFTPLIADDPLISMSSINPNSGELTFAETIGFSSWSPDSPGQDDLFGIVNFPVWFEIDCEDYSGEIVSDSVYITNNILGCTESMETAGYCSNAINPIFEEF